MKYLFLLLISGTSLAALSPLSVKESALKYHPTVLAALERVRAGEEAVTGATGAFDAKVISDYRRQMKGDYQTTVARTFLVKPTGYANSKIYAGAEEISNSAGRLSPVYNTGNPATTGQAGIYSVLGLQISLWKNLLIDPSRASIKNARNDAKIAESDRKLTEMDIARLGQLAYWEWVTAQRVKNAFEELLKNGEMRNEYLVARNKTGDIPQILVTENEQYIASRKGSLQAAKERLLRAEFALSLFYRDGNGEPIIPAPTENFEDYPANLAVFMEKLDLNSNIDELIQKRPDLKNLALYVDKADVDLELARQDLKPQIDVSTEYYKRSTNGPNMPDDYLMVMAQVSIPIERNLGKGNIAAASARKMVAQKQMSYGQQTYRFEIMATRKSLGLKLEQVTQTEVEFSKSKELVASETYKFKTGGGNLFLVNLREESQARAEASFHESRLAFMNTLLGYQALVSTGE
jgi:outer membrane protein TolC